MATMNFSIPDDIKERFNRTFANRNKSAIVAELLDEAVARDERKQQSDEAIRRIMVRRQSTAEVSTEEILRLRDEIRAESDATNRSRRDETLCHRCQRRDQMVSARCKRRVQYA